MQPTSAICRAAALAVIATAALVAPARSTPQAGAEAPILDASVWQRSVRVHEPILVRVTVTNPGPSPVRVVPPYLPAPYWALGFSVWDETGDRVPSDIPNAPTPYSVGAFARPWWAGPPPGSPFVAPRLAWVVPAGESAAMWIDLTQFYPLDKPGRYRVVLEYASTPEMLTDPKGEAGAPPLCTWTQQVDIGWVETREAQGADAEVAELLRRERDRHGWVLSSTDRQYNGLAARVWSEHPECTYAPYARLYVLWYKALQQVAPWEGTQTVAEACDAFVGTYPDFPLTGQLPVLTGLERYRPYLWERGQGYATEGTEPMYAEVRRLAAESGDYGMMGLVEQQILLAEEGARINGPRQ